MVRARMAKPTMRDGFAISLCYIRINVSVFTFILWNNNTVVAIFGSHLRLKAVALIF